MRFSRRHVQGAIILAASLVLVLLTLPIPLTPRLRARLTAGLGDRFDSQVDLKTLHLSVFPRVRLSGEGVVFRREGRADDMPLITIESFSAEASLLGLLSHPLRLKRVQLQRLEINVPPGGMKVDHGKKGTPAVPIIIDDLRSERAVLRILRKKPGRAPRVFEIHELSMQGTGSDQPWAFAAALTNPTPPGEIHTRGFFGPWNAAEPAQTPLEANYEFRNADLGVFHEIQGHLDSTGAFKGVLERIEVNGRTTVPDFALEDVGHPVNLETTFHSIVDGTSGDTLLQPVNGKLLGTTILTNGGVLEHEGQDGRTVSLDIVIDNGRIEDIMRLAVKSDEPPMSGALTVHATFVLPPGHVDAIDKIQIDGSFVVLKALFADRGVQTNVGKLSQTGQGKPADQSERVASNLKGRFAMRRGVIHLAGVTFDVPGARVEVNGDYTVRSETLNLRGTVRLDARVSKTTSGLKSFLIRLIEPLFRHENRTIIPITIRGTAGDPKVGLDVGRVF